MVLGRLIENLNRPLDAASSAAFRLSFGVLLLVSTLRFLAHGWVRDFYLKPAHFFHYYGLSWIRPLPGLGMYALYVLLALAALAIALGWAYRVAAFVFALGFSYAHLCDKSNYLNHYYLISLLAGWFVILPLDREFSLRARVHPNQRRGQVRAWVLYLLRFQVGVVYVFGGLGKLGSDWLTYGQPLSIWLSAKTELPGLGQLLGKPWSGPVFSWAGALFDLSIVPLLSWRVTRAPAYLVLVGFHVLTAVLFPIGMFPWLMIVAATLFCSPSWPRRFSKLWQRAPAKPISSGIAGAPLGPRLGLAAALYAAIQIALPLRSAFYPGNTLWSEEGFRFSWKVMLIEKVGSLEFEVVDGEGRQYSVSPREYLTPIQARMAATQPDMILELAHWIAHDFTARGHRSVRVYADCEVSFNGRSRHRLVDPRRDLTKEQGGLAASDWLMPAPTEAPSF